MENTAKTSLYDYISAAVTDGQLPMDFSLPRLPNDNSQIPWADGAKDGVAMYHIGHSKLSDDDYALMARAIQTAAKRDFDYADELFCMLGQKVSAISAIDALQGYIIDHKDDLPAGNIYGYGVHAILDSTDRECVKYGLSMLELFRMDDNEEMKEIIRTIGLSDEFSVFAVFIMRQWEDGNNEIWQLARKIHGWGRIHAIEQLEPVTKEIKEWLLVEGVHNGVMPAYSALTCWQKSDAETVLKNKNLSKEEFSGIGDIIEGLLDEGPVQGISAIEKSESMLITFLTRAKRQDLELEDYEKIHAIGNYFKDRVSEDSEIVFLYRELIESDNCRALVKEAVKSGNAINLAQELKLDYRNDIWELLTSSFDSKFYMCSLLIGDPEYKDDVLDLFRRNLPLEDMKTQPAKELGLGQAFQKQQCLESILPGLSQYPLEGRDFIETALQSAPVRTRNFGIRVLEAWVSAKETPLSELMPEMYGLLCQVSEIEPDDKVRERMDRLIAGDIAFEDFR